MTPNEDETTDLATVLRTKLSVDLWPTAGRALNLERSTAYDAAKRGQIPVNKFGRKITVPTAPLRRMLGLDDAAPASRKAA